jgi:sarcosine oxidase subunit delta
MTFEVACPDCGWREVGEFSFGGESVTRPPPDAPLRDLAGYLFFRQNVSGPSVEWWFHRDGCRRWFLAQRDTRTNQVSRTYWPADRPEPSG